ncbi:MAG TPA: EAL domain-containing protein [Steroidobacteraceae bacterium]|nr:EAL domain-containing protein [Steroidobacteraceae bacterium]
MTARNKRSFGREALAVYLAALLIISGTWAASRYLILRKFEYIEHNDVARSVEVMRKALVTKNTEIETVSRDFARWDDMYSYVSSLDPKFEYENFSEAGLDEMNVDLVWLLDPNDKLLSSFENDTDDAHYSHPASAPLIRELERITPLVRSVVDQEGTLRMVLIKGVPHVIAAQTVLHSDRSGPAAGTLVFARRIGPPEVASIGADSQLNVHFELLEDPSVAAEKQPLILAQDGRRIVRRSDTAIEGQLRIDSIDNRPLAVMYTLLPRSVVQSGQQGVRYLIGMVALLVSILVAAWHAYRGRLKRSADAAALSETRYRAIFERAASGIVLFDPASRRVLDANPQAQRLIGASLDELRRRDVATIFDTPVSLAAGSERDVPSESRPAQILRGDNERRDVEISIADIEPGSGRVHAMLLQDISHRREAERRAQEHQLSLQHLATHDALTGLPNRAFLNEELPRLIDEAARRGDSLSILYIDCDNFKNINDSRGHSIGDDYLRSVARRLRDSIASPDLVVRMGGDEFLVVTRHYGLEPDSAAIAERVAAALKKPVRLGEATYSATTSIGLSVYPRDATTMSELLRSADIALYEAKARGRDNVQMFDAAMNKRVHTRLALEQDLRSAVNRDAIEIQLQPIVDIRSGRLVSFEALARWNDPRHGAVPPLSFIEVAEASDLIVELGECVFRNVARQIAAWQRAGLKPVPVAVNVSAKQLKRSNLPERLVAIAHEFDIAPHQMEVELTESVAMQDSEQHVTKLHALRDLGIRVSVDDFGTGYSSLSYLRNLPIDYLKIDRTFVRDMNVDRNDAAIVRAIISMAQSLHLGTVAEGIETREHASQLLALGCSTGQGYFFSKPMAPTETHELLRTMRGAAPMQGGPNLEIVRVS